MGVVHGEDALLTARIRRTRPGRSGSTATAVCAGPALRGVGGARLFALVLACVLALLFGSTATGARNQGAGAAAPLKGRIAFSAGGPPRQDVYVVNADGSNVRRLTTSSAGEFDPDWSPNGRMIAYRRETRESAPHIYLMNADGSQERNLTRGSAGGISPDWSPDGRMIAFASVRSGFKTELWVMRADGSRQRRLGRVNGEYPDWSPDGRRIAFDHLTPSNDWDIWTMNANGTGARPLVAWRGSKEQGPSWSPNGAWIAFQSTRGASDGIPRVWIARADGSNARRLTSRVGERPTWSPDGSKILFTADGLFVAPREGGSVRAIHVNTPPHVAHADWR